MIDVPLLIEFAPQTSLYRERDLVSHLPIVRNGPAGTFVVFPDGVRVSLPFRRKPLNRKKLANAG